MGSIGEVAAWPVTNLPLYNTTKTIKTPTYGNAITESSVPAVSSVHSLLQRFAQFVHAITASHELAFIADTGCQLSRVYATSSRGSHQDSAWGLHQELVKDNAQLDVGGLDFGIHYQIVDKRTSTTTNGQDTTTTAKLLKLLQPLVLSLQLFPEEKTANVTLYLRKDYGPKAAARHLLNLAIAYISPEVDVGKTEKSQIVTDFPPIQTSDANFPKFLHSILEEKAYLYPHNIAIDEVTGRSASLSSSFERRTLTYSELNDKVSLFAKQIEQVLQNLDWPDFQVTHQKMIPVFLPNSTELNICINAISKAGHSFCVLPTDAPEDRLQTLLSDLNCNGILGIGSKPWARTKFGQSIIWIDLLNPFACLEGRSLPSRSTMTPIRRQISQDDPAYIVYTSGSTGTPKGVIMQHRNAMAFLQSLDMSPVKLPTGPRLRWMIMSAPTFDIMLMDNFMPLLKGGTVCIAARHLLLTNPESIMNELRATATFTVTSLAMLLRPERLPTLDTLFAGGEPVGQRILDNFAEKPGEKEPRRRFINGYGPTEGTVFATHHICDTDSRPSVIGVPFPGTRIVVLDENQSTNSGHFVIAPLGVAGELAISGPQLSPGYLNRPQETAQAFFQSTGFERWYKTGDRVRIVWTEDSEPKIDYVGRINSDQVKLNGRRVELPEIENVLSRAEAAAQVAVLFFKSGLVAFIMPWSGDAKKSDTAIEDECRAIAERFLPTWMQPKQYFIMDKLPYSVNGKVDRKGLQAILTQNEDSTTALTSTVLSNGKAIHGSVTKSALQNGDNLHKATDYKYEDAPLKDTKSIVHEALYDTLGCEVHGSATLTELGIDSLRALVFLQNLQDYDIEKVEIRDVLFSTTVDNLITMVENRRSGIMETLNVTNGKVTESVDPHNKEEHKFDTLLSPLIDSIDVSKIAADNDDEIYELSVPAKLRHFEYHCRAAAVADLKLENSQVEQVLPATNVQTRFLAAAIDPEYFDKTRLIGRPYVTHFPYSLPSDMDPARFQRAVEMVLPRYDCFRAVFVPAVHSLSPFAQVILSSAATKIPKVEIICDDSDANSPESLWRETINAAQLAAEAAMTIDRPGITVSWVWSPNRARCVFILTLFHANYDGTQMGYMFDAILAEYENPGCNPPVDLLPMHRAVELNLSYDWVSTVVFWAGKLAGVPGSKLGSQKPSPQTLLQGSRPGCNMTHMRSLSVKASMTMRELSQSAVAMSNTLLTIVEAAWASVLAQTFSSEQRSQPLDIQFGTVLNGRRHQDSLRCMAPMVAALPLRLLLSQHSPPLTNRQVCTLLSTQRQEAQPYLQMPCPSLAHARMGTSRFDTILLVQALAPSTQSPSYSTKKEKGALRELPGFNYEENLMAPYKEIDIGFPVATELWPGKGSWDEKMLIRCAYSTAQYDFLDEDWVLAALSALDEAVVRITSEPDGAFFIG